MSIHLLSILDEAPDFSSQSTLSIAPLAPLSLVTQTPGKYYRSASTPSEPMIYGMLENALGWHISQKDRIQILKHITRRSRINEKPSASGVGFESVLQFHVQISYLESEIEEQPQRYDDYWSQHLRTGGLEYFGGSREHDFRVIPLVNAVARKDISMTDSGGERELESALAFKPKDKINLTAVRGYFPRYYVTPTPREYVVSNRPYVIRLVTSKTISEALRIALSDPEAPLYLGSNDGWVDVDYQKYIGDGDAKTS